MVRFDDLPSVAAPPERLADWVEYCALTAPRRSVSRAELIEDLRISGSVDAQSEPDRDVELEVVADDVFNELDDRLKSTGGDDGAYPFNLTGNTLDLKTDGESSTYAFQIFVAFWSNENDHRFKQGVKVFEDLSAQAARQYLGGSDVARSIVFGFPRQLEPAGFAAALDRLCGEIGEGGGANRSRLKIGDQKDAKLDVVAWRDFLDERLGKLIAFGQCAAGNNWRSKTSELGSTIDWWTRWVVDRPGAWPIKMFFVPHRVPRRDWFDVNTTAGILFDRCRISVLAARGDPETLAACAAWTRQVIQKLRPS